MEGCPARQVQPRGMGWHRRTVPTAQFAPPRGRPVSQSRPTWWVKMQGAQAKPPQVANIITYFIYTSSLYTSSLYTLHLLPLHLSPLHLFPRNFYPRYFQYEPRQYSELGQIYYSFPERLVRFATIESSSGSDAASKLQRPLGN